MLEDFVQAVVGLERLKALGGTLALDDFGTGYSSLNHIHRLPVDTLRRGRRFTRELTTSESARNIFASLLGLCGSMKLECVVEAVETVEQATLHQTLGCV